MFEIWTYLISSPIWSFFYWFGSSRTKKLIAEKICPRILRREYINDKPTFMRNWTNKMINVCLTKEKINKFVLKYYLTLFKTRFSVLLTEYFPKLIDAETTLVNNIINDRRTSLDVMEEYQHLQRRANELEAEIRLFQVQYLNKDSINIDDLQKGKQIGEGTFSDVYLARYTEGGISIDVALKVMKMSVSGLEIIAKLTEVECLRYIFFLKFLGEKS